MDVSGLTKAVQEFWQFVQLPLLCLVLLFVLLKLAAPHVNALLWNRVLSLHVSDGSQIALYKSIKRFGLDKLIPVLAGFLLLLTFNIVRITVVLVGQALPPTISYNPNKLLYTHMPSADTGMLWCNLGHPASVYELNSRMENAVSNPPEKEKNDPSLRWLQNAEDAVSNAHIAFSVCKFLLLYTLISTIFEIRLSHQWAKPVFRSVLCSIVLCLATALCGLRYLYRIEEVALSRLTAAEATVAHIPACDALTQPPPDYLSMIGTETRGPWWSLGTADTSYLQWMLVQFRNTHQ